MKIGPKVAFTFIRVEVRVLVGQLVRVERSPSTGSCNSVAIKNLVKVEYLENTLNFLHHTTDWSEFAETAALHPGACY